MEATGQGAEIPYLESSLAEFGQENVSTLSSGVYLRRPQPLTPSTGLPKGGGFLPRPPRPSGRASPGDWQTPRGSLPGAAAPLLPLFKRGEPENREEA